MFYCPMLRLTPLSYLFIIFTFCALSTGVRAEASPQKIRVGVLDWGQTQTGMRAADQLSRELAKDDRLIIMDREENRAAARGIGYAGSLNMTLQEARDLGGAIGADFYITGDAQTLRRSPSTGRFYFEAYASIFIVSARSGRLLVWDRPTFEAPAPEGAESALLLELSKRGANYGQSIKGAREAELKERAKMLERNAASTPVIEDAPVDDATAERERIRLPQPYRRLRPAYPETAARAEAEATVDVQVDIDERGEVIRVEIVRWAGFGLDEAAAGTAGQLRFSPARRDGVAVPMRVMLRYNFRRPPREAQR